MSLDSLLTRLFAGKEGAEEQQQLHSWMKDYKDNLDGLNQLQQVWNDSEDLKNYQAFDPEKAFDKFRVTTSHTTPKRIKLNPSFVYRFVAIGLILFCCGLLLKSYFFENSVVRHVAHSNETILLPDGTSVDLYKGAIVEYSDQFVSDRQLSLHGEGFFKVKPDAGRPFRVYTTTADIRVLGTSFLVLGSEEITSVAVAEGKVLVSNNNADRTLIAGDKYNISKTTIERAEWNKSDLSKIPDFIMANGEKLEELLASLFSNSGKSYIFKRDIPECRINAFFYHQTIEDIVQEISLICGFSYLQEAEVFVIE